MSFAAMATWQALLVMGVVVAAAVGLFLIKLKPPQILIPSLTLWSRVLDEKRERTLWERIRKAVSLAVVVLITLAIALAILRPQRTLHLAPEPGPGTTGEPGTRNQGPGTTGARVSVVIDSSWSMLAQTSSGQTRWDRAIARARELAAAAGGEEIVLSTTADGVVEGPTPDVALIEAALDRISPSGGDSTAWPRVDGARVTHFLTDGAIARPLDAAVVVDSVYEAAANVAITAFDVRPGITLEQAGQAFLSVANYAPTAQDVHITLTRGTATVLDVHAQLAPGEGVDRIVPLNRGGDPRLHARVSAKANALVVDDEAVAFIQGARVLAITVVSDQPQSFGPLLSKDPVLKPTFVSPANYKPGMEDMVIFDRVLPAAKPVVPALYIAPPSAPKTSGVISEPTRAEITPDVFETDPQWLPGPWHPLLAGVDVQSMAIEKARAYAGAGLRPIALSAAGTPLVYVSEASDQRFAVFTFSVTASKLMFAPGFPALMGNAIDWLTHPASGGTRRPGPATFVGTLTSLVGPNGKPVPVTKIGDASIASLTNVGFYEAISGGATSVIAVNAGDPETSDLRRTRIPEASRADSSGPSRGRPWWLFAAVAALFLIGAEWFTWQRRITV